MILRQQLDVLAALPLPEPAQKATRIALAALAELEHSALWLQASPPQTVASPTAATIDQQVFDGLMEIAGPIVAIELKQQMRIDLHSIQSTLEQALITNDRGLIRDQCHNLTAIAGAAGAFELQLLATRLGELARQDSAAADGHRALADQLTAVQASLIEMLDFVSHALGQGTAPGQAAPIRAIAE